MTPKQAAVFLAKLPQVRAKFPVGDKLEEEVVPWIGAGPPPADRLVVVTTVATASKKRSPRGTVTKLSDALVLELRAENERLRERLAAAEKRLAQAIVVESEPLVAAAVPPPPPALAA